MTTITFVPTTTAKPATLEAPFRIGPDGTLTPTAAPSVPLGSSYDELATDLIQLYALMRKFRVVIE